MQKLFVFLVALSCGAFVNAATIFVKPQAVGDASGSDWANAKGDLRSVIDSASSGDEIRVAKGLYYWTGRLSIASKTITIIGGYAGVSESETPDSETFKTIISGDVSQNDQWVLWDLQKRMYNAVNTFESTLGGVIQEAALYVPEVPGEYQIATINSSLAGDNVAIFTLASTCTFTLKGVWIVGAGQAASQGTGAAISADTSNLSIEDVRFVGCYGKEGVVQINQNHAMRTVMKNCLFKWNLVTARGIFRTDGSNYTVDSIKIVGGLQTGSQGSCAWFLHSGSGAVYTNCWTEKCYGAGSSFGPSGGVGVENANKSTFANCVFTNNFGYGGIAPAAINFRYKDHVQNMNIRNSLFINNKCVMKKASGTILNLGTVALGKNGGTVEGCTFIGNTCDSIPSGTCKSIIAAPLTITPRDGGAEVDAPFRNVFNCTFAGNRVLTSQGDNGAKITAARSIAVFTALANNPLDVVIANCTFTGDTAYPDVIWTGADPSRATKILNSIFWKTGDASAYQPFKTDTPEALYVTNCIVNGITGLPAGIRGGGITFADPLLGGLEAVAGYAMPVIRPGARVPGLQGCTDLVRFTSDYRVYLCYAAPLAHVSDATVAIPATAPLADAVDTSRPVGGSTKGAVQTLSAAAENGYTLLLKVVPEGAGSLTGGASTQVVPQGSAITAVTAASADAGTFIFTGWKRPDGTLYSSDATLSIPALNADLALNATFSAPDVTWTFDLNGAGTFSGGASNKVFTLAPGSAVPSLSFTIDEDYCIPYGWDPPVPETVGIANRTFTYTYLAKTHRIVRLDTNVDGGTGDGSSWANAMTNIQEAIDAAGVWSGEVWMKKGIHKSGSSADSRLVMRNNVAIMGGFEGVDGKYADDDAEHAARNVELYRTILTGDTGLDDTWKGNVSGDIKVDGVNLKVIGVDGNLTYPAPTDNDVYFYHSLNNNNASPIFDHADHLTVNLDQTAVLDGLTIMGGTVMDNGLGAHPRVLNCTFLGSAKFITDDWMTFTGCTFSLWGVDHGIYVENIGFNAGSTAYTLVTDCVFTNCATTDRGAVATQNAKIRIDGCAFVGCWSQSRGPYDSPTIGAENGACEVLNCLFKDNLCTNGYQVAAFSSGGGVVSNCLFVANRMIQGYGSISDSSPVCIARSYKSNIKFFNCPFISNTVSRSVYNNSNNKNAIASVVYLQQDADILVNCTFDGNHVDSFSELPAYPAFASMIAFAPASGGGLVNCTFNNNEAAEGDIGLPVRSGTSLIKLINALFWNAAADYVFATKTGNTTAELVILDSTAKGFNPSASMISSFQNVSTADPIITAKWVSNGVAVGRRLSGGSPVRSAGRNIFSSAGKYYYLSSLSPLTYTRCDSTATVTSGTMTLITDAIGDERPADAFSQGAIQKTAKGGTVLLMR